MLLGIYERLFGNANHIFFDGIVALGAILSYLGVMVKLPSFIKNAFSFVGKHSMNIFLFHTFFFTYWFKELVYYPRNPLVILVVFLSFCVIISIIIEKIKIITRYSDLVRLLS